MGNVDACCQEANRISINSHNNEITAADFDTPGKAKSALFRNKEIKEENISPKRSIILTTCEQDVPTRNCSDIDKPELSEKAQIVDSEQIPFLDRKDVKEILQTFDLSSNIKLPKRFIDQEESESYDGFWNCDKFNGYGVLIKDGGKYEGFWHDGVMHGIGRHINSDGDLYEGHFIEGIVDGTGRLVKYSGYSFTGSWTEGKMHGEGQEEFEDGNKFVGLYQNGLKHGRGKFSWADGSYYSGDFLENEHHGYGEFMWSDNRLYKGDWYQGVMHGYGRYSFPDGSYYVGEFKDNKKEGFGKYFWNADKYYEGNWVAGKQEGTGTSFRSGIKTIGIWKNGKLNETIKCDTVVYLER